MDPAFEVIVLRFIRLALIKLLMNRRALLSLLSLELLAHEGVSIASKIKSPQDTAALVS